MNCGSVRNRFISHIADTRVHKRISSMTTFFIGEVVGFMSVSALLLYIFAKLLSCHGCSHMADGRGYGVLITGCDSGFGHQLARCLDQKGFVVFAGCLFPQGSGALKLSRQSSNNVRILKLDVTRDEEVTQAKKIVKESLPEKGGKASLVALLCTGAQLCIILIYVSKLVLIEDVETAVKSKMSAAELRNPPLVI